MITIIHYEKGPGRCSHPQFHVERVEEAFSLLSLMEKAGVKQVKIYWNNISINKSVDHQFGGYNHLILNEADPFNYED